MLPDLLSYSSTLYPFHYEPAPAVPSYSLNAVIQYCTNRSELIYTQLSTVRHVIRRTSKGGCGLLGFTCSRNTCEISLAFSLCSRSCVSQWLERPRAHGSCRQCNPSLPPSTRVVCVTMGVTSALSQGGQQLCPNLSRKETQKGLGDVSGRHSSDSKLFSPV